MPFQFTNTLTRRREPFVPLEAGVVRMYNCGPTVYDHPHIGNFRAFVFADILRRSLEYAGFQVRQVMNLTDVGHMTVDDLRDIGEDKLEAAALRAGKTPMEIADQYAAEFFDWIDRLNVRRAHVYPRATEHIPEMIEIIRRLVDRGYAYASGGNVYFDLTRFPRYGALSGNTPARLQAGARVEPAPDKRHPFDFALWKRDPKHLMQWDSPWGRGFPGWHIECSAMSMKHLGETLDIHTGGEDNIFPHHECEIAQSEAATGKTFVRLWMHVRHLLVNGRKMSKSEGTFLRGEDLLSRGEDPMALRYLLLSVHYGTNLNFTWEALEAAGSALDRLRRFHQRLVDAVRASAGVPSHPAIPRTCARALKEFQAALEDDLNLSAGLAVVHEFMRTVNALMDERALSPEDAERALMALLRIDSVLGILEREKPMVLPPGAESAIRRREQLRSERQYAEADRIRAELRRVGVLLEDTPQGTRWRAIR